MRQDDRVGPVQSQVLTPLFFADPAVFCVFVEELADLVICAISFANQAGIDISDAVMKKIEKNAQKYPVEKYKGRF